MSANTIMTCLTSIRNNNPPPGAERKNRSNPLRVYSYLVQSARPKTAQFLLVCSEEPASSPFRAQFFGGFRQIILGPTPEERPDALAPDLHSHAEPGHAGCFRVRRVRAVSFGDVLVGDRLDAPARLRQRLTQRRSSLVRGERRRKRQPQPARRAAQPQVGRRDRRRQRMAARTHHPAPHPPHALPPHQSPPHQPPPP